MSVLWVGWEIFINFVEEGLFCYLLIKALGYPKDKSFRLYFGLLLLVIFTTILNITVSNTNIVILTLLVADIIFATICFGSNYSSRFFGGCTASIIAIIANTFIFWITAVFTIHDLDTLSLPTPIRIQMGLIYLVICCISYFSLIQIKAKNKITLPLLFRFFLFLLLGFGIIASNKLIGFSISIQNSDYIKNEASHILGFIGSIYLFVLLGCVILFEVLGIFYQRNNELSMKLQESKLQQHHLENIESSMKTLREWKHDYHHHIQVMQILLENKKHLELQTYIAELNTNFMELTNMVSTGNPTLDAILSSKILVAKTYGITVDYTIFFPEKIPISQTDLCIVLGNLLDNAIESCRKPNLLELLYINITIKIHKKMLYIKISNSSNGEYIYDNGNLISTKKESNHGFGCKKIYQIVEELGGFCNFEPQENSFATTIIIPLPDEEGIT